MPLCFLLGTLCAGGSIAGTRGKLWPSYSVSMQSHTESDFRMIWTSLKGTN